MTFELFLFDIKDHTSSREEENNDQSGRNTENANKKKAQQSPITSYFKERKTVQGNDAKRAQTADTGK